MNYVNFSDDALNTKSQIYNKRNARVHLINMGLNSSDYDDFVGYLKKNVGDYVDVDAIKPSMINRYYQNKNGISTQGSNASSQANWDAFRTSGVQTFGLA